MRAVQTPRYLYVFNPWSDGKKVFQAESMDGLTWRALFAAGKTDPDEVADAAAEAVTGALNAFRDRKATVGRARIFGDKSVGMDDPGMLAMSRIVRALADREG